ncbi:MAG: PVC-type heme-binding CxxCH protein, partial [Acidobacteriota bacterium]
FLIDGSGFIFRAYHALPPMNRRDGTPTNAVFGFCNMLMKLLEDTDGDGHPDRSTVFADGLAFPTGVMRWKQGILVTAAPDVWYLEDTNGDNRADLRRVVLTGFSFSNPQHTVSDPVYGLDNWIYLAHERAVTSVIFKEEFGDRGSEIRFPERPDLPALKNDGRNIRFRPDTHQLEALSGNSQFGHTFDQWGHHFTVNNSNHVRHEVITGRYLQRNPDLLVARAMQDMSDHGNAAQVFPITRRPRYEMLTSIGQITSACGLTLYLGGAFPSGFERVSFVAEPVHNLIHRDVWSESGCTFIAKREQEEVEFLASTDSWFRPVFLYIGPDGALYLVDYYREMIEHPEWMAREVYETKDLYRGTDRGRIYRIVPDSPSPRPSAKSVRLGKGALQELVRHLENANIWWRRTTQRLLVGRQDAAAVPMLVELFRQSNSPAARVHALWTLEGLGQLDVKLVEQALEDSEPGVRENAIRLAERHLLESPSLVEKILKMGDDPDLKVRFQLLCTLGDLDTPQARSLRHKLLFGNIEDHWMQIAGLSASSDEALKLFQTAASRVSKEQNEDYAGFFRQVCAVIGVRQRAREIQKVIQVAGRSASSESAWWRAASLEGLAVGLERTRAKGSQKPEIGRAFLLDLLDGPSSSLRRASLRVLEVIGLSRDPSMASKVNQAAETAADSNADPERRTDAVRLLALVDPASRESLLKNLVDPLQPQTVQAAAVQALGRIKGAQIGTFLLQRWRTMTPAVRAEAAETLFLEPGRVRLLVDAIERDEIQPWTLEFRHKRRLIMHSDAALREHARGLLEKTTEEQQETLKRYEALFDFEGDVAGGEQVFERECAQCHTLDGVGGLFGPDLATIRNRPAEILLIDILRPSKSITQGYDLYVVRLHSGENLEGVIASQTPIAIKLLYEDGKEEIIPRSEIKEMYAAQLSAMPEDLDKKIDAEEMVDLLAFLKRGH